jgi:hypothetical protein
LGKFWRGLATEDVGIFTFGQFSGHLAYFLAIWYIFPNFGTFFPIWYVVQRKIWQPCPLTQFAAASALHRTPLQSAGARATRMQLHARARGGKRGRGGKIWRQKFLGVKNWSAGFLKS